MRRTLCTVLVSMCSLSCWSDAEKLPPPLPQDGTALPYTQVTARLAAQTNSAKDNHFLNQWDGLVDVTLQLEQTTGYLMRAPDLPEAHKARIQNDAVALTSNVKKLREAARAREQAESLELIRRIHNQVRDLQDIK